jgi:hypothetical protein
MHLRIAALALLLLAPGALAAGVALAPPSPAPDAAVFASCLLLPPALFPACDQAFALLANFCNELPAPVRVPCLVLA